MRLLSIYLILRQSFSLSRKLQVLSDLESLTLDLLIRYDICQRQSTFPSHSHRYHESVFPQTTRSHVLISSLQQLYRNESFQHVCGVRRQMLSGVNLAILTPLFGSNISIRSHMMFEFTSPIGAENVDAMRRQ
jgi:hypothetical protein